MTTLANAIGPIQSQHTVCVWGGGGAGGGGGGIQITLFYTRNILVLE